MDGMDKLGGLDVSDENVNLSERVYLLGEGETGEALGRGSMRRCIISSCP